MSQAGIVDFEGSHPQVPTAFVTNVGTAIPIANVLEILGTTVAAHGIPLETTGSGNTVTIVAQYASAAATSLATNAGFSSFNSAQFTVDANGYVSLSGSGSLETLTGDDGVAVSPIGGTIQTLGNVVANSTHSKALFTTNSATNIERFDIQVSAAIASTNIAKVGLAAFNSTYFTVDANGFVSLNGGSVGETITGNTGGALSPVAGNWNILGTSTAPGAIPVQTSGSGNTLTVQVQKSQAIASTNASNVGLAAFNSTYFTVDANGFVSLVASSEVAAFTVDANTAPGTNPVVPNGSGLVTVIGGQVAAGTTTNVVRTVSLAANTYTIQIQRSQAVASSTVGDNGVSHFNSAFFTVDSNGFVSLNGSAVGETITGNVGGALSPTAGNWNILGSSTAAGTTPVQTSGSVSTLTVQVQKAQAIASTNASNVGLAAFDSARFSVDANGFVTLNGSGAAETITGNTGGALSPTAGNWNIVGNNTALNGFATYTTGSVSTLTVNSFGTNKWVVNPTSGVGTHTTIQAAVTAASAGDTIYVTANSSAYTENITLKVGVNIVADISDSLTPNVTIAGTLTLSTAGTVSLSGLRLQTNSAAFLTVSGSAASVVNIDYCYLNASNNTGISFTSSSSSANITITNCTGDVGTTGIGMFAHSSAGQLNFTQSRFTNSGGSSTQSTCSSGSLNISRCTISFPITTSSTASGTCIYTLFDTSGQTPFTAGGSGLQAFRDCIFIGGSAVGFSAGSATPILTGCSVSSSNTNAISGAGTLTYSPINFFGTSSTVNTTTQVPLQVGPKIYTNGGISFDSGTNLLSVYKTGTWTPNLQISGSNTGITYTTQLGGYTQIGNVVTIWFNIVLSSKGANTGNVTISNLPITTSTNGANQCLPIAFLNGVTAVGYTGVFLILAANSTVGQFDLTSVTGNGVLGLVGTNITNTSSFATTASYIID